MNTTLEAEVCPQVAPSADAVLVRALAEKLKGWMEEDLKFLGVEADNIHITLDGSGTYAECEFSTDACRYLVLVYNNFSLSGWAHVTDSVLWSLCPQKADEDWVFDDTGPFCEDAWQKLLLAIIGMEEEVARGKAQVLQQRLEELNPAATETIPAQ